MDLKIDIHRNGRQPRVEPHDQALPSCTPSNDPLIHRTLQTEQAVVGLRERASSVSLCACGTVASAASLAILLVKSKCFAQRTQVPIFRQTVASSSLGLASWQHTEMACRRRACNSSQTSISEWAASESVTNADFPPWMQFADSLALRAHHRMYLTMLCSSRRPPTNPIPSSHPAPICRHTDAQPFTLCSRKSFPPVALTSSKNQCMCTEIDSMASTQNPNA